MRAGGFFHCAQPAIFDAHMHPSTRAKRALPTSLPEKLGVGFGCTLFVAGYTGFRFVYPHGDMHDRCFQIMWIGLAFVCVTRMLSRLSGKRPMYAEFRDNIGGDILVAAMSLMLTFVPTATILQWLHW
jgi:hypothetical protein